MLARGHAGLIVNTGSKQGITTPPGNLAYNVSKSALKTYTEGLAHELRNMPGAGSRASAHSGLHLYRPDHRGDRKAGRRLDGRAGRRLHAGAPGGAAISTSCAPTTRRTRELDERRMAWAIGDIIENRPALSRWHPDYKDAFQAFVAADDRR